VAQALSEYRLSEQRLRKLAGDFARRVHACARKHKIPLRYFAIGDKTKHAQAEKLRPLDQGYLPFSLPKLRLWSGKPKTIKRAKWCCAGPRVGR